MKSIQEMNPAELLQYCMENGTPKDYVIRETIPAGESSVVVKKEMDGKVLFASDDLYGTFTTLQNTTPATPPIVDFGVNQMTMTVKDSSANEYRFQDQPIPLEAMLVPGRVKSPLATNNATASPSNPIFRPRNFPYVFANRIEVEVSNPSEVDQEIVLIWSGYELKGRM